MESQEKCEDDSEEEEGGSSVTSDDDESSRDSNADNEDIESQQKPDTRVD